MNLYCNDCGVTHRIKNVDTDKHIHHIIGYKGNPLAPYYICYYACRCGNNIVLEFNKIE